MSRRLSSSAASRPGWCRIICGPGWTNPILDPKLNRSYAELAAHYGCLIDPARSRKPRDKARVDARCRMCGTRSGAAGSSSAWSRCRPRRTLVRGDRRRPSVPAAGGRHAGRGVRGGGEGDTSAAARGAVRARDVGAGEDRPGHPRPGGPGIVLGAVAAHRARPPDVRVAAEPWCSSSSAAASSRPTPAQRRTAEQTDSATAPRRRDARSTCGPQPGAASRPPPFGPACRQVVSGVPGNSTLYRLRCTQGVIGLADRADPGRLEAACTKSIAAGDPSYRTIKGVLGRRREHHQLPGRGRGRRSRGVPGGPAFSPT